MATTVSSFPRYDARVETTTSVARWHAYTAVVAAACVMIGVYWDISWHMSIGRDSFWTPAHIAIQLGGIISGVSGATSDISQACLPGVLQVPLATGTMSATMAC